MQCLCSGNCADLTNQPTTSHSIRWDGGISRAPAPLCSRPSLLDLNKGVLAGGRCAEYPCIHGLQRHCLGECNIQQRAGHSAWQRPRRAGLCLPTELRRRGARADHLAGREGAHGSDRAGQHSHVQNSQKYPAGKQTSKTVVQDCMSSCWLCSLKFLMKSTPCMDLDSHVEGWVHVHAIYQLVMYGCSASHSLCGPGSLKASAYIADKAAAS